MINDEMNKDHIGAAAGKNTIYNNNSTNATLASIVARTRSNKKPINKFEMETPGMIGHVFQTYGKSKDKIPFTKTMEALQRYFNKHCEFAGDLSELFQLKTPTLMELDDITADEDK